jgi:hypothetical protein
MSYVQNNARMTAVANALQGHFALVREFDSLKLIYSTYSPILIFPSFCSLFFPLSLTSPLCRLPPQPRFEAPYCVRYPRRSSSLHPIDPLPVCHLHRLEILRRLRSRRPFLPEWVSYRSQLGCNPADTLVRASPGCSSSPGDQPTLNLDPVPRQARAQRWLLWRHRGSPLRLRRRRCYRYPVAIRFCLCLGHSYFYPRLSWFLLCRPT